MHNNKMESLLRQKPELFYAYSLLGNKNISKGEKEINFAKLNKGFYDGLIHIDSEIRSSRESLKAIKSNGIKELIYSNKPIPDSWKNKLGYYNELFKTLNEDQRFMLYLGKGVPDSRNREEKRDTGASLEEARGYSTSDLFKSKKYTQAFGMNTMSDSINAFRRKTSKTSFIDGNQKKINEILEEYKTSYPFELKNASTGEDLPKINNQISRTASCDKIYHLAFMSRSEVFKSTIFSNLIPNQPSVAEKTKKRKPRETKNLYGPFLNFDYASLNKKIEISNAKVRQNLEEINNYGPYYSHCPSCKNKNLEFYETMEPGQCVKLLQQLKKMRKKH